MRANRRIVSVAVIWIDALDFLGSLLVLVGLVLGGRSLARVYSRLEADKAVIRRIFDEKNAANAAARERGERVDFDASQRDEFAQLERHGIRPESFPITGKETAWLKQDIELTVVNYLRPQLRWPFILASGGAAISVLRALLLLCGVASGG